MDIFENKMLKIVIPVSAILLIATYLGALSFIGDLNQEVNEGDVEGIANVTTEYAIDEVETEVRQLPLTLVTPYIIGGIVALAKLFGIILIFK